MFSIEKELKYFVEYILLKKSFQLEYIFLIEKNKCIIYFYFLVFKSNSKNSEKKRKIYAGWFLFSKTYIDVTIQGIQSLLLLSS